MGHGHDIMFTIGSVEFDITVEIMTLCVMLLLVAVAFFVSTRLSIVPGGKIQNIAEMIVEFLNKLAVDMIGPHGKKYVPLGGSIFLFVLFSNWMGLLPADFRWLVAVIPAEKLEFSLLGVPCLFDWGGLDILPPTSNLNTPLALALVTLIYYNYCGIRGVGFKKYLLHHLGPVPELAKTLVFPVSILLIFLTPLFIILNIIEHIARTFSLTVRLFCNIMGEHSVMAALIAVIIQFLFMKSVLFTLLALFVFPIPLIVMLIGILTGAVQALIFTLLTFSYIASFVGEHH